MNNIPDIFKSVKDISFTAVLSSLYSEKPNRGGKINCDFHNDSEPSFQVNQDYGYCFGCGWRGDIVAYVSEREKIRPIEAARLIALKYNLPVDRSLTQIELKNIFDIKRKRNISKQYQKLEEKAFLNMVDFRSRLVMILGQCGFKIKPATVKAVHMLPNIEEYMMILSTGDSEKRLQLLREGVLTRWANLS